MLKIETFDNNEVPEFTLIFIENHLKLLDKYLSATDNALDKLRESFDNDPEGTKTDFDGEFLQLVLQVNYYEGQIDALKNIRNFLIGMMETEVDAGTIN